MTNNEATKNVLLDQLLKENNVTAEEVKQAVAERGYYPADTPIEKYDSNFINNVLIEAWPQVFETIKNRHLNESY
jgi:spore coat protein CotF